MNSLNSSAKVITSPIPIQEVRRYDNIFLPSWFVPFFTYFRDNDCNLRLK